MYRNHGFLQEQNLSCKETEGETGCLLLNQTLLSFVARKKSIQAIMVIFSTCMLSQNVGLWLLCCFVCLWSEFSSLWLSWFVFLYNRKMEP